MVGIPRHTENAWILSRRDSVDQDVLDKLKQTLKDKVPDYDQDAVLSSSTTQGGDCKYNAVLT